MATAHLVEHRMCFPPFFAAMEPAKLRHGSNCENESASVARVPRRHMALNLRCRRAGMVAPCPPYPLQPTGAVPWHALIARNDGFAELAGTFKKGSKQCVVEPGEGLPSLNGF